MAGPLVMVPYFKPTCDRVIEPYLKTFGFRPMVVQWDNTDSETTSAYLRLPVILNFSYWPEHYPNYRLMVSLARIEGNKILPDSQIGLWYAMPAELQVPWNFKDETQLTGVLTEIRDEVLPRYAKPLWEDPLLLQQSAERFYEDVDAKNRREKIEQKRRQAERSFKAGNFQETINIYSSFARSELTLTDRKRLEIAHKKIQ
jgi:hypothetical protein